MPDAPADTGNAPEGRSDPSGPKLAGFPLWVWGVAAVGTFAMVWFLRNHSSARAGSGTQAGMATGTNPDFGISTTDPMTMAALLQQMQELATRLSEGRARISPAPSIAPVVSSSVVGPSVTSYGGAAGTSHLNGDTSTEHVSSSGLPDVVPLPAVVQAARSAGNFIFSGKGASKPSVNLLQPATWYAYSPVTPGSSQFTTLDETAGFSPASIRRQGLEG